MLYLPAIAFDRSEIRIPCPTDDLIALCKSYIDRNGFELSDTEIIFRSPGLTIYSLAQFFSGNGRAAESWEELLEWMGRAFFDERIEYSALEPYEEFTIGQQNLWLRWLKNKTRKRAAAFLDSLCDLGKRETHRVLSQFWSDSLTVPKTSTNEQFDNKCSALKSFEPLPIRHFWIACGKLQTIQASFSSELQLKKLAAMKQLAYGASHEINNPLANIATRAQSLISEESNASKRQRLSVIYSQAMRAHEMISDMMLFAQPPEICLETVCVKSLVQQVLSELRTVFEQCGIVVGVRQYPNAGTCDLDPTQFAVALKALLQNAVEAIGSNGEIRIQIWKRSDSLLGVSVADNGCGINESDAGNIFDPFYSGREAGRGLGFGLSKVWRIVELHGGRVALENQGHWSTRFAMTLPIHQRVTNVPRSSRIDNAQAA